MKSLSLSSIIVVPVAMLIWIFTSTGSTIQNKDSNKTLSECFNLAHREAESIEYKNGYWIGYSIQRMMEENSFIGTYYSDKKRNHPTLSEIISGKQINNIDQPVNIGDCQIIEGMVSVGDDDKLQRMVNKEIGILFHFDGTSNKNLDDIIVSNLSLHVNLKNDPLIWLNRSESEESIKFLKNIFDHHSSDELKEDIIRAIGLHEPSDLVFSILKEILNSGEKNSLREEAAFWMGQQNNKASLSVLMQTAQKDKSEDVREKAIFAISEMGGEQATETLIKLAREADNNDIRSKSMFWLSQRASDKAGSTIADIAQNDNDSEIQKQAVFALTQLSENKSIPILIDIAKTHRNPEIRKTAIFWLGQSEDKRALEAIVEIIKN